MRWRQGKLRGFDPDNDELMINFADQEGIYVLHHHNTPTAVYVGMTSRQKNGLFDRLDQHRKDQAKGRWDTFSWFGFRPVAPDGTLQPAGETVLRRNMIEIIEAILIETILPSMNRQFGKHTGKQYEQAP